jgi:hypothetical protein
MKPMMRKLVSAISLFAVLALPALCLAQNLNSQLAVADGRPTTAYPANVIWRVYGTAAVRTHSTC